VVGELWRPAGGAYNVDGVLSVMVKGLEEELEARMSGNKIYAANKKSPSRPRDLRTSEEEEELPMLKQGADLGFTVRTVKRVGGWAIRRARGGSKK
jgi:hypothetical protein